MSLRGIVFEKESHLGVQGLIVRISDEDALHDDLLGIAVTDSEGKFEISYAEKDFRTLTKLNPRIYFSVYDPPLQLLMHTREALPFSKVIAETVKLDITTEILGANSPTHPEDRVEGGISIQSEEISIEKRDGFDIPNLEGFGHGTIPGAPALLEQVQHIALPLGGDVLSLEVVPGHSITLPGEMNPFPIQKRMLSTGESEVAVENIMVTFTPPNPKFFEGQRYPESLVELESVDKMRLIQIASIRVKPLQYDPRIRKYVLYPNLQYTLKFDIEKAKKISARKFGRGTRIGRNYATFLKTLLCSDLIHSRAKHLFWTTAFYFIYEDYPHIIITDNYSWPAFVDNGDGTTRPPKLIDRGNKHPGDIVAEFEQLAKWRTSRGTRSRVVTISEIVGGAFGDFTDNGFARDLQEVIRNFLKAFKENFGTFFVLLGGDLDIVPMRQLVGDGWNTEYSCHLVPNNPPSRDCAHYINGKSVVKLYPRYKHDKTVPLSTTHKGIRIPYNREAGSGFLGWYHTTEGDFKSKDFGFTRLPANETSQFVIVEGPDSIINDDYYWVFFVNNIPSDFYYASLKAPVYSIPGKHDFDANNNVLYGQYHAVNFKNETLDGVASWPGSDVFVGRVLAGTGDQARAFVNKVITYESLESPDGTTTVDTTYLQKILYASSYLERIAQKRQTDITKPPEEGYFTHEAGQTVTKIHNIFDLKKVISGQHDRRLVARQSGSDVKIPYDYNANASTLGWFFTSDNTYATKTFTPTRFVKVVGPEVDINPEYFFWDPISLEPMVKEKEDLRTEIMNIWYPNFTSIERHHEDYFDLSAPPPFLPLKESMIRNSMDNGVHFLTLSGHGNWPGCCKIDITKNPTFNNAFRYFLCYAVSCLTARPDGVDSLAKVLTNYPEGGAVAYIGYTRYGSPNSGKDYEKYFWKALRVFSLVGLAAGIRGLIGDMRHYWTEYTQTLFGDPAMPVWGDVPKLFEITHPAEIAPCGAVNITVRKLGSPVSNCQVTIMGGWTNSSLRPQVLMTGTTDWKGKVSFQLPESSKMINELQITATARDFKPYIGMIQISNQ
jgi:hypothetical protein